MTKMFFSLFLIVISSCTFATANEWCNIQCGKHNPAPHVFCNYSPYVVSNNCGTIIQAGLTQQDVAQILNAHNSLRQRVANGEEGQGRPGPQPRAKYVPNLVWDRRLVQIAQAWANQCQYGHRCSHLGNSFSHFVGQNVAIAWNSSHAPDYVSRVHSWYKEVASFNRNLVKHYVFSRNIGHYSQIVWAKTTKLGCGGMKYKRNGINYAYLVCNYGPPGNVHGQVVYETYE